MVIVQAGQKGTTGGVDDTFASGGFQARRYLVNLAAPNADVCRRS
jgi:hypothetical protein